MGRRFTVRLEDGSDAIVSEGQHEAITALHRAVRGVALGLTGNLVICEQNYEGVPRDSYFPLGGKDNEFVAQVVEQGKFVRDHVSLWEGTAPMEARSLRDH